MKRYIATLIICALFLKALVFWIDYFVPYRGIVSTEDFSFTVTVDETTINHGSTTLARIALLNNSGKRLELSHKTLFRAHIPGFVDGHSPQQWLLGVPTPVSRISRNGSIIKTRQVGTDELGSSLPRGTHQLTFYAVFSLSGQSFRIPSEPIYLTIV